MIPGFFQRALCGLFLVVAAGSVSAQGSPAGGELTAVEVAPVSVVAIAPRVRVTGTVMSTRDAAIAAEVQGRLVLVAEVGDRVKQGEPVAVIDDRVWRLQRENDGATIRRLQANLGYMARQQERLNTLASKNNTAQAELDELQARREMVAQEVESAKVALARTEYDLARTRVLAPFDGVIAARHQGPGEYTKQGEDIVRLVNTAALEVSARAPIAVARHNREGAQVQVTGDFGAAMLPIRTLVRVGDAESQQVEVRLQVSDIDWIIGEPVEVTLTSGPSQEVVAVPRSALVKRKSSAYVFRVDDSGIARKIPVVPGDGEGGMVAISGEIQRDDRVVVTGGERLRDGQQVRVREASIAVR